jgi:hypothetical protein
MQFEDPVLRVAASMPAITITGASRTRTKIAPRKATIRSTVSARPAGWTTSSTALNPSGGSVDDRLQRVAHLVHGVASDGLSSHRP